ncbi:MAG: cupin domain-containing protein [Micromonosporaceae bacterium]
MPGAPEERPALARCIAVSVEEFATEHWGRAPLLSVASDPGRGAGKSFDDLITVADVDELVSRRGVRTPFLRMARDGRILPPARYAGPGGAGATVPDQALDERVLAAYADGATLVLQGLHRLWPPLGDFARQLAGELGHPVGVNAYLTPRDRQGFATHYDTHDVFVLQIAGTKRWRVHPPIITDPLAGQPWQGRTEEIAVTAEGPATLDTVLEPGDALYLPRGWLHSAQARDELSMHLTVGVFTVTRYALVEALLGLATEEPALRRSLPMGIDASDPDALGPELDETLRAVTGWLGSVDPEAVADRLRQRLWRAGRPAPIRPLAQAEAIRSLGPDTRLAVRPQLPWRLQPDGADQAVLEVFDRTVRFPAYCEPAVRALLTGAATTVAELPGLVPADQLVLARRLLQEAVVVPLDP